MRHRILEKFFKSLIVLIAVLFICPFIQALRLDEPHQIRAEPLYEQCASLRGANSATTNLLAALRKPGENGSQNRVNAAKALAGSCDARAIEPLVAALKDREAAVRVAAVEALGRLGDRDAIDPLIEALSDEDWRVRAALARALCSFQVHASSYAALNLLVNPADRQVTDEGDMRARCQGVLMVNQLRDVRFSRKAIGFLFMFLDNQNEKLRGIARETAMELKNTRNGYHELIGVLKQSNFPDFRRKAAYYLGKFNIEEARPALIEASTEDRDTNVRLVAKEALEGMKKQ